MLDAFLTLVAPLANRIDARTVLDVGIVALMLYWLLSLISGTTAATVVRGIFILVGVGFFLSSVLNLTMLGFLLRSALPAILLAIPILFAPEIRRALEQVGRAGTLLPRTQNASTSQRVAEIVAAAAQQMSERRWGALIVVERGTALGEYVQRGTVIDGALSVELLLNIFYPNSPLHDGAVIVHGERVVAAGVVLPLAQATGTEHMGTRHRAAIGITEGTDAVSVVVSEETGRVSLANAGRMVRNLTEARLIKVLTILEQRPAGGIPTLVPPKGPPDDQPGLAAV